MPSTHHLHLTARGKSRKGRHIRKNCLCLTCRVDTSRAAGSFLSSLAMDSCRSRLAKRLGISRTSMVNIEAGRQRAPLHLLWQIAELLETKVALLVPSAEELLPPQNQTLLDKQIMKQIEDVANGDPATIRILTGFVTKTLQEKIAAPNTERKAHGQAKSRRNG